MSHKVQGCIEGKISKTNAQGNAKEIIASKDLSFLGLIKDCGNEFGGPCSPEIDQSQWH